MAGCGFKKMAKGGMVKKAKGGMKISPRKAMAMGKKPSGSKNGVQKFAFGGMVSPGRSAAMRNAARPMTQQAMQQNVKGDPIGNIMQQYALQANRVSLPGPQAVMGGSTLGAVRNASNPQSQEMLNNLANLRGRASVDGPMNQAPKGPTLNPIQALNKLAIRRAKGGMVKKGCK